MENIIIDRKSKLTDDIMLGLVFLKIEKKQNVFWTFSTTKFKESHNQDYFIVVNLSKHFAISPIDAKHCCVSTNMYILDDLICHQESFEQKIGIQNFPPFSFIVDSGLLPSMIDTFKKIEDGTLCVRDGKIIDNQRNK